jgi:methylase of polypeptide subunit release factors
LIKAKIQEYHGNRTLTRILDMGTGNCHSAFAYAEMFPEAEVIGIDLAAPYIR